MVDAPWRCSQCGTINEPVANACRTCGRWPSLFDLEAGKVDEMEVETQLAPEPSFEPELPFEPEIEFDDLAPEPTQQPPREPAEPESPSARRRRLVGSIIVPLAVVIYLVISIIVNR